MKQKTLAMMTDFERYSKKTRRAAFLEQLVPLAELWARIEPCYPAVNYAVRFDISSPLREMATEVSPQNGFHH
jgi:hypothetical protein